MKEYLEIANSKVFFFCSSIVVGFIILQSILFMNLAFKEGKRLGLSNSSMIRAFRTGAVSTVIPTLAVIVALITMVPVLGIPFPWLRLSVIGSAPYELMAAGIGAKAMGIDGLGGVGYTGQVFASSVWTMCIGSVWSVTLVAVFLRRIQARYSKKTNDDPRWKSILTNAAFLGVFSIFIADPVTKGGIALLTLASGAVIMTVFAIAIVKLKQSWLKEFALAFSMIGAMACTILFTNIM